MSQISRKPKNSILFSGRGEWIRTTGPCLPKTVLYQAELHPDYVTDIRRKIWLLLLSGFGKPQNQPDRKGRLDNPMVAGLEELAWHTPHVVVRDAKCTQEHQSIQ